MGNIGRQLQKVIGVDLAHGDYVRTPAGDFKTSVLEPPGRPFRPVIHLDVLGVQDFANGVRLLEILGLTRRQPFGQKLVDLGPQRFINRIKTEPGVRILVKQAQQAPRRQKLALGPGLRILAFGLVGAPGDLEQGRQRLGRVRDERLWRQEGEAVQRDVGVPQPLASATRASAFLKCWISGVQIQS